MNVHKVRLLPRTKGQLMGTILLEDILLPATPELVRAQYATLAERAQTATFGLLEEDMVVLDTETTGLSFRDCELIQISAARISGREIVERFDTFVHPTGPIPAQIVQLTGIRDIDVTDAPRAEQAVAALADFVGGMPVIAHNATFDRTFIERVPGGHEVSDTWIDSLALSRIALPRLSTHRLSDMAEAFGTASVTHRATDDVDALAGMWRILLVALSDLPSGLLAHLAQMHDDIAWVYRPILNHIAAGQDATPFHLKTVRHELVGSQPTHPRSDMTERNEPPRTIARDAIEAAFAKDGLVAQMYGAYETRPEQIAMALEVTDALNTSTHRSIEAGTGVGKSVAYLLPEVLFAKENNCTVGVATKTNALTDQLVSHEMPALQQAIPGGFSFASLKGYEHYPCLRKLDAAARGDLPIGLVEGTRSSEAAIAADMLTAIAVVYAFAAQSVDGDLDALGINWRNVPRRMLTTTTGECHRSKCPYYPNECMLHGTRRRAAAADVVITNHSLLLRNVAAEGKILPPIRHWVVDEAHGFEAEARRQWAIEVAAADVRQGFEVLGNSHTGVIHTAMVQSAALEGSALYQRLLTKLSAAVSRTQVSSADFFQELRSLTRVVRGSAYDTITLWIDEEVRAQPEWAAISETGLVFLNHLDEAAKDAADVCQALVEASPQLAATLSEDTRFIRDTRDGVSLILAGEDETYVYSAELSRRKRDMGSEKLVAEKVDVGSDLGTLWLPEMESVIFSSATVAIGESFEHFEHGVGLDLLPPERHRAVRLDSSFDFDRNMAVIVARDLPQPNDPRYLAAFEDLLYDVHVKMGGSVLTLFTNRREMEQVAQGLVPRLAAVGLELAWQERNASPRRLRQRFIEEKDLSLMALKSFWEGFDAAGETLRCVVIAKLPFSNPSDPLVRERELRDKRSWWKHSLPEAVISVKQAAGRLIRTASDTGVLVLADSRLVTKRYGQQFISSLPSHNVVTLESGNVGRYIEMWQRGR